MGKKPVPRNIARGESAFLVRVMYRQNATWMGEIQWLDGREKLHFRSFLEMVTLMQQAMEKSGTPPAEYRFRSWEDKKESVVGFSADD